MTGFLAAHNLDVAVLMSRGAMLLDAAKKVGADAADAVIVAGRTLAVSVLNGKLEEHESAEGDDFGLRVFVGKKQAVVSGNKISFDTAQVMAERAVAMAKAGNENPYAGLPDESMQARLIPHLDLFDPTFVDTDMLVHMALETEGAMLGVKGVSKSSGASANANHGSFMLLSSNGFAGAYATSFYTLSATAIAESANGMERDFETSTKRHFAELAAPQEVGRVAGERAVRRLDPKKISSGRRRVIFDKRIANALLSFLGGAINGAAIARKSSFLAGCLGEKIFRDDITITDDPHRARGYRSRPFDGEGVKTHKRNIVDRGLLTSWLLDTMSARELNLTSTGHAERGISGVPSPATTNFILQPGKKTVSELIGDVGDGIYVGDLIGRGANLITGDYSGGLAGFLIEKGELTSPISEITMAGCLKDMFRELIPANDLDIRSSVSAPSCYVGEMMIAGR